VSGLVLPVFVVKVAFLPKDFVGGVVDGVGVQAAAAEKHEDKQGKGPHFRSLPRKTARARLSMNAV